MPVIVRGNYHIAQLKSHGVWVLAFAGTTVERAQEADVDCLFAARLFVALPPTFTPAFLSSTVAACFAARAIAGSFRTRSCAIEPPTTTGRTGVPRPLS